MAARPRKPGRKNWPPNLYARDRSGLYYFWRHPHTGKDYALGRDFNEARIQAIEANVKLGGMAAARRLVDRVNDEGHVTVSEFLPTYRGIVETRGVATNTLKTLDTNLRKIDAGIGQMVMRRVTTQDINDKLIEPLNAAGKDRAAGQLASYLSDMWKEAAGKGKVSSNPVDALRVKSASVKRERLTLDVFLKIYAAAEAIPDRWIANMMRLAIVTAQPRECLVALEFSDVRDGFVWNERGKTGARIKLPVSLTVPRLGWNLDDCIKSCRDRIVSRHLLHHNINRTLAAPGAAVALNAASKGFQRAREAAGIAGDNPPTLHEIRSLALRLYKDAYGRDFAQALAGHKQGTTTDIYTDVRGAEWIEVKSA